MAASVCGQPPQAAKKKNNSKRTPKKKQQPSRRLGNAIEWWMWCWLQSMWPSHCLNAILRGCRGPMHSIIQPNQSNVDAGRFRPASMQPVYCWFSASIAMPSHIAQPNRFNGCKCPANALHSALGPALHSVHSQPQPNAIAIEIENRQAKPPSAQGSRRCLFSIGMMVLIWFVG